MTLQGFVSRHSGSLAEFRSLDLNGDGQLDGDEMLARSFAMFDGLDELQIIPDQNIPDDGGIQVEQLLTGSNSDKTTVEVIELCSQFTCSC